MRNRLGGPSAALPPPERVVGAKELSKRRRLYRPDTSKGWACPAPGAKMERKKKREEGALPLSERQSLSANQSGRAARRVKPEGRCGARAVPFKMGYALWAATYDHEPNPLLALEERVLEPRLPDVRGRTLLDVGCGTGRWLIRLRRRGAHWGVGIDLSGEMLRCAASKCPRGAWLARADALALPLRPKTIDLIICSFTLGHIGNLSRLAKELARVARKGADVYLSGLHPEARAQGWRCAFRHRAETVEIPEFQQPLEMAPRFFSAEGFEFTGLLEPHFGNEERPIFVSAGKAGQFESATTVPAIFICHFRM